MKKEPSKIPKWLELVAERDYIDFILHRMYDEIKNNPPIYKIIDEATGFDKEKLKEAKGMIKRIEIINKILNK